MLTEPGEAPRAEDGWAAGGEVTARLRVREVFFTWASLTMSRARRGDAVFAYDQPYAVKRGGELADQPALGRGAALPGRRGAAIHPRGEQHL